MTDIEVHGYVRGTKEKCSQGATRKFGLGRASKLSIRRWGKFSLSKKNMSQVLKGEKDFSEPMRRREYVSGMVCGLYEFTDHVEGRIRWSSNCHLVEMWSLWFVSFYFALKDHTLRAGRDVWGNEVQKSCDLSKITQVVSFRIGIQCSVSKSSMLSPYTSLPPRLRVYECIFLKILPRM